MTAPTLVNDLTLRAQPCQYGFITDLVLRCGQGDDTALAELFDLFYVPVTDTLARAVPGPQVAEAVKDVFVNLWRRAPLFRPEQQSAVSWVMALTPPPALH